MRDQTLAVQRMQDLIAERVGAGGEATLQDLALVSGYSPWYSYRLFRETLGITPAVYQRKMRLTNAAGLLRADGEGRRVADVAFDCGFGSVDAFTRAFCREFGRNPGAWSRDPSPISLFVPYGAKYRELYREARKGCEMKSVEKTENVEKTKGAEDAANETAAQPGAAVPAVFVRLVHKPERLCLVKRGERAEDYWSYCQEVGCDVWGLLLSMCGPGAEPVCLWLPDRFRKPGTSRYVQGVEVGLDYAGELPEGFDALRLPDADYLLFQGQPFAEEDYCEAIASVSRAVDEYDPTPLGYAWDDASSRIQLEPRGARGCIELRPVHVQPK